MQIIVCDDWSSFINSGIQIREVYKGDVPLLRAPLKVIDRKLQNK